MGGAGPSRADQEPPGRKSILVNFYRAMHYSANRGIEIACRPSVGPSVTLVDQDHVGWKSWKLIARTIIGRTPSLFVAQGNIGKFWGTRGGVRKNGVLEHKSGNISETRKDKGTVTMESL